MARSKLFRSSRRPRRRLTRWRRTLRRLQNPARRIGWLFARSILLVVLPFFLLVSSTVLTHRLLGTHGWVSISFGVVLTTICISLWGARVFRRRTGRERFRTIAQNVALPLVLAFCVYALGWLTHFNAKSTEIRDRYRDLHPTLRLAIGAASLADFDVVITEISRSKEDYGRMGLTSIPNSLHFRQEDGWIHAVDLRTVGRSELRNGVSFLYFRAMGFRVLRHGGTGDHLHVALPRPR